MTLQIEETSLKEEKDPKTLQRKADIQKELATLNEEKEQKFSKWQSEKKELDSVKTDREQLEHAKLQLTQAQNDANYELAAKLKYETIPELEKKIKDLSEKENKDSMIQQVVDEEMIAKIVSRWTHIEVSRLMSTERQKILNLPQALSKRVMGQDEALRLVSDAIMRSKAQIQDENRPLGSFLFLGPD
jgi:ATP-dependent Clp protease ATP-binding subunit ClpB